MLLQREGRENACVPGVLCILCPSLTLRSSSSRYSFLASCGTHRSKSLPSRGLDCSCDELEPVGGYLTEQVLLQFLRRLGVTVGRRRLVHYDACGGRDRLGNIADRVTAPEMLRVVGVVQYAQVLTSGSSVDVFCHFERYLQAEVGTQFPTRHFVSPNLKWCYRNFLLNRVQRIFRKLVPAAIHESHLAYIERMGKGRQVVTIYARVVNGVSWEMTSPIKGDRDFIAV